MSTLPKILVSNIKKAVRNHRRLIGTYRFCRAVITNKPSRIVYSFSDLDLMIDDWIKLLPSDFDCVIGIPRGGLLVADRLSWLWGIGLSTPDDFLRGVVWQSKMLNKPFCYKKVLVVEDVMEGKEELRLDTKGCVLRMTVLIEARGDPDSCVAAVYRTAKEMRDAAHMARMAAITACGVKMKVICKVEGEALPAG